MAPSVFLTGATGYIGGSIFHTLVTTHEDYDITVLLRNPPGNFSLLYPNVEIVKGDFDNARVITAAAKKADIVIHCGNSDHEPSIKAIIAGLAQRKEKSFLIHLSGTGIVSDFRDPKYLGELNPKVWSDVDDLEAITSLPDDAPHRITDKIVLAAAAEHGDKIKTAIMCPPDIYGAGRGPGKKQSVYLPVYLMEIKQTRAPFFTGSGGNTRSWVHISDLMNLYMKVVEAAAEGGGKAHWGKEGYYFASTQEVSQIDVARVAGKILMEDGLPINPEPKCLSLEEIAKKVSHVPFPDVATYLFASSSRTKADRATKLFNYAPSAPSLLEAMVDDFDACKIFIL
ncbi:NAD(P)-binding protein [Aulographum hederae CBS 113979]|uniref:NAD(P)-binding protein n=1 Tax=Aulographum hederae CBS 113979 TaxID=1176131 RepID=A0A6G1GTV7_9PEZI|nr:NAD(P)-binding protein [Aulographum hederae CBS 113979]